MAKKTKKKTISKFRLFMRKFGGVLLIMAALAVYMALITYHQADPTFNNRNSNVPLNLLGGFGADLSEAVLFGFGVALPLFLLGFFVWGYHLVRYGAVEEFKARLLAFVVGVLSTATLLNLVCYYRFGNYGLGGKPAYRAASWLQTNLSATGLPYAKYILAAALLVLSVMALNLVLGITFKDWYKSLRYVCVSVAVFIKYIAKACLSVVKFFRKLFAKPHDEPEDEQLLHREPSLKPAAENKPEILTAPKAATPKKAHEKTEKPVSATIKGKKDDGYCYPDINLLSRPKDKGGNEVSKKELEAVAHNLENVLQEFGVDGQIVNVRPGPVVTLYELRPKAGTKTARVIGLSEDIARSMKVVSVRIAVVPGSDTIGIEMPNTKRETVWLKDLLSDDEFKNSKNTLNIVLGKDIGGKNTYADLAKMPHLLVAGTTGSGKSVGVNSMILSLLYRMRPEECKLIMIDPKMLEFSMYNGIPHLLTPVITDPAKAVIGLKWAVREMEERYRKMAQLNVRNIAGYNQKLKELKESGEKLTRTIQVGFDPETGAPIYEEQEFDTTPLPYIVIVVDEMADLMLVAGKEVEAAIQRLAQMARAAGLHLIMSTQRPSVDVITGTIKANFPSRISFQVTSKIDSRTILGEQGAEQLLGMGDMLYMPAGLRPLRVHGSFVKDSEVEAVVNFLKQQRAPEYVEAVTEGELDSKNGGAVFDNTAMGGGDEDLYSQALAIVRNDKKASTSYIQRKLRIGYNRAAALIDRMEEEGIVSAADHVGRREVIG